MAIEVARDIYDKQAEEKYLQIKDKLKNTDILARYKYLEDKLESALSKQYEEGSKSDIALRAIIRLLADTESEIKGLG